MSTVKPTLLHMRKNTSISSQQLAQEAGISLGQSYTVEIGGFASPDVVEKVIAAFNRLTASNISKHDISYNATNHTMRRISHV